MSKQSPAGKRKRGNGTDVKAGRTGESEPSELTAGRATNQSLEENLARLAAANLSSDRSLEPGLSTAMIKLVSALAGVGSLVLIYLLLKLFI